MVNSIKALTNTRKWIEQLVIQLSICPFAKHPFESGLIHFEIYEDDDLEGALINIATQLKKLEDTSPEQLETTLIVLPNMLEEFDQYLGFVDMAEALLVDLKLEGIIQIASFHPTYQFADTAYDDRSNYTNRSPYPMIHLLREDSIYEARLHHEDVNSIPSRNVDLLRSMPEDVIKKYVN